MTSFAKTFYTLLYLLATVGLWHCTQVEELNEYSIIPQPNELIRKTGHFMLDENTSIVLMSDSEDMGIVSRSFQSLVQQTVGLELTTKTKGSPTKGDVVFSIDDAVSEEEGYELLITSNQIKIKARKPVGLFYAIQTLKQLIPLETEAASNHSLKIPAVEIKDSPRFQYRGMHLDVARHFFPVEFVKKYIDLIALHKMNTFHWHLTEDQGWRIEIKKYPKLTDIGAWRKETLVGHLRATDEANRIFDNKRAGGFYTQEEVKEIVAYAKERFVTIIPEIEMPGHSQAALAAYPELACTSGPFEVATWWGVFYDVYCPKEETFKFLENVLSEVFELFPSKYIHIGGDECPKERWVESDFCQDLIKKENLGDEHGLQSYFIARMEKFINSKGRAIIGWDEILEGGLAPNATVMSWRGTKGGIEAAKLGHEVIMTPYSHLYFDFYQSDDTESEPLAIGGFTNVEKVYSYEPIPDELSDEEAKYILGAQANVWTEYIETGTQIEYMVLPRMTALSEVVWSLKEQRNWPDFVARLEDQFRRYDKLGLNYAKHVMQEKGEQEVDLKEISSGQ